MLDAKSQTGLLPDIFGPVSAVGVEGLAFKVPLKASLSFYHNLAPKPDSSYSLPLKQSGALSRLILNPKP